MHYMEIKELAARFRKNPTVAEKKLWKFLRDRKLSGRKFLRQHPIVYEIIENECFFFIPDFYCDKEKLIIQNPGFFVLHIRNAELSDIDLVLSKIKQNFR